MKHLLRIMLWLALSGLPLTAQAGNRIFLTGAEAGQDDYYTYVGVVLPGPGWHNGKGMFQRYWLDRLGYQYESGPRDIDAQAWGGEAAIGYVSPTTRGWWSVSAGLRYVDTDLSPDDRAASARGGQLSPKVQLETDMRMRTAWRAAAIASYTFEQSQYWGRLRATRSMAPRWSLGGELTANGNDEFDSLGAGLVALWQPGNGPWNLAVKSGIRFQEGENGLFAGMEVGRAF